MDGRRLNRRVLIQYLTDAQDSVGQPGTWANLIATGDGKLYASIRHLPGLETIRGGAETTSTKASIRIRYRSDVTGGMQALHGSLTYQIKSVVPDEVGREYVDLVCEVVR